MRRRAEVTTIYKLCERDLWPKAEGGGWFHGNSADARDGFIHFSTAAQLAQTAAQHFAGMRDLILLAVDTGALGAQLKWETSRGGQLFPHLYGALPRSAVCWVRPLSDEIAARRPIPQLDA